MRGSLLVAVFVVLNITKVKTLPIIDGVDLHVDNAEGVVTQYLTVHQESHVTRQKKDGVHHVTFPSSLDFKLTFEDREIYLHLMRNTYMTSDLKLSDENGHIAHELWRMTGIYQDRARDASFVVQCNEFSEHCTLRGSMLIDKRMWNISPESTSSQLHKAVRVHADPKLNSALQGHVHFDQDGLLPEKKASRERRALPSCEFVECFAIVDESVWEFYLLISDNVEATAVAEIHAQYLALYTQADIHYDFAAQRRPGTCIRLYLAGIHIQKTSGESWSFPNERSSSGGGLAQVKGKEGLVTCGQQGDAFRNGSFNIDLVQCFTRKDIVYNTRQGQTPVYVSNNRSLAFKEVACNTTYAKFTSGIIEEYGDKVELLLAHVVIHGIGGDNDNPAGCSDADAYIMASNVIIPDDDFKLGNIWLFSSCTLDDVFDYLSGQPDCLANSTFTEAQFNNFDNQPLAGTVISMNEQCEIRFGLNSTSCDPDGLNRTFIPHLCDRGMFCTNGTGDGNCTNQDRPYDGTPCDDSGAICLKGICRNNASCSCNDDCPDTNSYCSRQTGLCECEVDFFDNSGICAAKVDVGETCPEQDACRDPNAVCVNGNCTCNADFYADSGSCSVLKCIGEDCADSLECKGDNVECSGSTSLCACPMDRFLNVSTGNCDLKKELGAVCEPGQCADPNAVCNPLSGSCRCAEGFATNGTVCLRGCPLGWEQNNGSCYLFGAADFFYEDARAYCDTFDSDLFESNLVQIDTVSELTYVKDFITNRALQPNLGYWNDLFELTTNGNEVWRFTGDPLIISDWRGNNPDDLGGKQSCTVFFKDFDYEQADIECTNDVNSDQDRRKFYALCEIDLTRTVIP